MEKRRKFQGVLNILSFNRHFYYVGMVALTLLFISRLLIEYSDWLFWSIIAAFIYGLIMPLLVSAYVYDFSGYYDFQWLRKILDNNKKVNQIVNINAGFDETSFIIEKEFPQSEINVFDFYDSSRHTEAAIKRARNVSLVYPNTTHIKFYEIPIKDKTVDLVFLLSAVHEIRSHDEKVQFLKECNRMCKQGGSIIMVEHLRDFPNFLAFTIGFTHFYSKAAWRKAFNAAGFSTFQETKFTPFMSIFKCCP
jgi:ubiquinone/menaquinone biosynthesis C-methylase UbiE